MSRMTALAFLKKINDDPWLRDRYSRLSRKDVNSVLQFAAENGYFFNAKAYRAVLEMNGQLSDDSLQRLKRGLFVVPALVDQR
jgi:hypothetical protein